MKELRKIAEAPRNIFHRGLLEGAIFFGDEGIANWSGNKLGYSREQMLRRLVVLHHLASTTYDTIGFSSARNMHNRRLGELAKEMTFLE